MFGYGGDRRQEEEKRPRGETQRGMTKMQNFIDQQEKKMERFSRSHNVEYHAEEKAILESHKLMQMKAKMKQERMTRIGKA